MTDLTNGLLQQFKYKLRVITKGKSYYFVRKHNNLYVEKPIPYMTELTLYNLEAFPRLRVGIKRLSQTFQQ